MAEYIIQDTTLIGIADSIRAKTGKTDSIPVPDMRSQIDSIPLGGDDETMKSLIDRSIVSVTVTDGVTSIGKYAFDECKNLEKAVLPQSVTEIKDNAFANCSNLKNVELPNGITSFKFQSFANCSSLELTHLPDETKDINGQAFINCKSLKISKLPDKLEILKDFCFANIPNLRISTIPKSVKSIGNYIFNNNENTYITFEGTPNSISSASFSGVSNLTVINVPWSEGEVANAPWGATNATINYNYTEVTQNAD